MEVLAASGKRCIVNEFLIWNSGASSGDVRKFGAQRAKRGKLYRETGLKAIVVSKITGGREDGLGASVGNGRCRKVRIRNYEG